MNTLPESKRQKAFRLGLARAIPRFAPNDKSSLQALEGTSLGQLLVHYANWVVRFVAPRRRTVVIEPAAASDPRWTTLQADMSNFLSKVEKGEDLTPHLSLEPLTRGYTPSASATGPNVNRWSDKDMTLNIMGYHHFHPSGTIEPGGFATRGDVLIFAHVTRDTFTVVALFDHSVFNSSQPLTAERARLWQIFDERTQRGASPGSVIIPSPIASSGHSLHFTYMAMQYARTVRDIDPMIDDPAWIAKTFDGTGAVLPAKQKWKWYLSFLDLGILEKNSDFLGIIYKGPN